VTGCGQGQATIASALPPFALRTSNTATPRLRTLRSSRPVPLTGQQPSWRTVPHKQSWIVGYRLIPDGRRSASQNRRSFALMANAHGLGSRCRIAGSYRSVDLSYPSEVPAWDAEPISFRGDSDEEIRDPTKGRPLHHRVGG